MNYAILLAAGSGTRMESHDLPKCFIEINSKQIFEYSLDTFLSMVEINHVVLVVPNCFDEAISLKLKDNKKVSVISGGNTRQESVFLALTYLNRKASDDDLVLIHDAARPLVNKRIILDNINTAKTTGACMTAIKAIDTVVESKDFVNVDNIPNRNGLFLEQTPATFKYKLIHDAHINARAFDRLDSSDDCILAMQDGHKVALVSGERNNFKITNEIDLALFKTIINN